VSAIFAITIMSGSLQLIKFQPKITKFRNSPGDREIIWEDTKSPLLQYAEANPDAPQNLPDDTNLFSFRNQQAAQPNIQYLSEKSILPKLLGNSKNLKIVSNQSEQNQAIERLSKIGNNIEITPSRSIPEKLQPDVLNNQEVKNAEGQKLTEVHNIEEANVKVISLTEIDFQNLSKIKKTKSESELQEVMKPRPRISQDITQGSMLLNDHSSHRIGKVGVECKLNPFGIYIQKMLRSIEEQWHQLIRGASQYIQYDMFPAKVVFTFSLQTNGTIDGLSHKSGSANSLGVELCRQSIASRSPFGEWSEEMINTFGQSDQITITFEYK
jgi:hypothetical protein